MGGTPIKQALSLAVVGLFFGWAPSALADENTESHNPTKSESGLEVELSLFRQVLAPVGKVTNGGTSVGELLLTSKSGLRILYRAFDWWGVGLGLTQTRWASEPSKHIEYFNSSGETLNCSVQLRFEPHRFAVASGSIAPYLLLNAGVIVSGSRGGRGEYRASEFLNVGSSVDARVRSGYGTSATLGVQYMAFHQLGIFTEVAANREIAQLASNSMYIVQSDDQGRPILPPTVPLQIDQLSFNVGVQVYF